MIKEKVFIPLSFDVMFRKFLTSKEILPLLEYLVAYILKKDVTGKVVVENSEHSIKSIMLKDSRSDLILKSDKEIINIELNNNFLKHKKFYKDRNLGYALGLIISQQIKTENYIKKKVYQINFNNDSGVRSEGLSISKLRDEKGKVTNEALTIIDVSVENYIKECYTLHEDDPILLYCKLLKANEGVEFESYLKGDEKMTNVAEALYETMNKLQSDDYVMGLYDAYQERENKERYYVEEQVEKATKKAIKIGKKEGLVEGKELGIKEVAQNMLESKMDIEIISKVTGLTKEEIENLN